MFTGTGKTPAGVSFMEKTVQQDTEQFKFRLDETGKLVLQFQRQDVASGLMERQMAGLTVLARGAVTAAPTVTVSAATDPSQYQPEYPVYQERILAKSAGQQTRPTPAAPQAAAANAVPAASQVPQAESVPSDAAGLLSLAKRREQAGQVAGAIELYERFLKDWPAAAGSDDALFRLAKCLETVVDGRNIKRAYELYVKLQAEYPYSGFVDQAKERARYISRTFFRQ
jgi:TolA-binding protein